MTTATPSDRHVRIAVQLQPQHAEYGQIRDALLRAEDLGVDIAFNWDHLHGASVQVSGLYSLS